MVSVVDNSLRDSILEFEASIMAYSTTSVSDPHTRISVLISLDYWALSIINRLATCLININKGECREVLGLDFKKLTRKDYWLKDRIKQDMEAFRKVSMEAFGNPFGCKTTQELNAKFEKDICKLTELLAEIKKTFSVPSLFENFICKMLSQYNDAPIIYGYEQLKEEQDDDSLPSLAKIRLRILANLVNKGLMRFAPTPSPDDLSEVNVADVRNQLPCNFKYCRNFNEEWTKMMKFIHVRKGVYIVDRVRFIKYFLKHFDDLTTDQFRALVEFNIMMKHNHQDILVQKPDMANYLAKESPESDQGELNYFAPAIHFKEMLKESWLEKLRSDKKYDHDWINKFVDDLMAAWGDVIAKEWQKPKQRPSVKAGIVGCLAESGVIKGSDLGIAKVIVGGHQKRANSCSRAMGRGKNKPYAEWIAHYVK